jgi:hypothetical protein
MDHDGPVCAADAGKEGIVQLENSEPLGLLEERDKIIELSGNGPEAAAR